MTVAELLDKILAAYPGASPEAMATFKPVFYARFRHREGDALQAAAEEVLATFRPKYDQKFPIPADFEPHMPSLHRQQDQGASGPPIRAALEARTARVDRLHKTWLAEQGLKIKAARHLSIYGACVLEVLDLCRRANDQTRRIILTAEQIAMCEMRALTSERAHRWPPAKTNEEWDAQLEQIRQDWANQQQAAA